MKNHKKNRKFSKTIKIYQKLSEQRSFLELVIDFRPLSVRLYGPNIKKHENPKTMKTLFGS